MSRLRSSLPFLHHALLFVGICTATRVGLLVHTGPTAVPWTLWPGTLISGLIFDLLVLAWLLAPPLLWAAIVPARWRATRIAGGLRLGLFVANAAFLLFVAVSEFTFWEEFSSRFNFIAVDYLIYTHEVIGNLRESYPLGLLFGGIGLVAALLGWLFRGPVLRAPVASTTRRARATAALLAFLLPSGAWLLADIDRMAFSGNAYANELSGNGLMTFTAALRRNEIDYDRFYATLPESEARAILLSLGVERMALPKALEPRAEDDESFDPSRVPLTRPPRNVVIVTVESLSAEFLGVFGNPKGLTPRLDALAAQGLLFTRLYATGTRTVRGLEALTLGTPPIPGQSIVRRPGNEHLSTLGEVLRPQGFETLFLYGGYGYFDNMNAFYAGNDYRITDRTDFPKSSIGFENVWGVADEDLFGNVLTELDRVHAGGRRFLAQVMTTSNHRPYTYPDGRIDIPSPGGRDGAVKYTDHAIGRFIDQARSKPWFADTLFIIVADHCASAAGRTRLPVHGYHIPMILFAPGLLAPGRDERLLSQIDVAPTVLDLLGLPGDNHFFGTSAFEQGEGFRRRAFISNYQELGYLTEDRLIVLGPKQRVDAFAIDARGQAVPTEVDTRLRNEAIAFYQSAFRAFRDGALRFHR